MSHSSDNPPLPPDRGHLATEHRLPASSSLDELSITQTLELINAQDRLIADAVRQAIPAISALVQVIVRGMRDGGRLIYLGAGTSGRLGVLDASECPPTFQSDPNQVIGLIAGGDSALRKSSEDAEDDPAGAHEQLRKLNLSRHDTVIGIAAGGTTPYVLGALHYAKSQSAATALLCCTKPPHPKPKHRHALSSGLAGDPLEKPRHALSSGLAGDPPEFAGDPQSLPPDHLIPLLVGPEVLTGSTRMKAGTATKLALNMITTTTMVQLGKAWGNLMVDLRASNAKLRDRAARILLSQCPDLSRPDALALLDRAAGHVKLALVMHQRKLDRPAAEQLLAQHANQLRPILGPPL
ncbi:MAG: N-acetylmuramic acid 6-phosphate etherase [Phycisphaeraceae bacterium]